MHGGSTGTEIPQAQAIHEVSNPAKANLSHAAREVSPAPKLNGAGFFSADTSFRTPEAGADNARAEPLVTMPTPQGEERQGTDPITVA
ncbi:hypothetical protein OC834_007711, partial [Tilletia horrida]